MDDELAANLKHYRAGKILSYGELKALPDGAAIHYRFRMAGETAWRIDGVVRATRTEPNGPEHPYWFLEDGSAFAADLDPFADCEDTGLEDIDLLDYTDGDGGQHRICVAVHRVLRSNT